MLRKNTAGQFIYFGGINATTGAALTGATFACRRCIDGTFAAATGTITEDAAANGFYKMALSQADTNGNDLAFFFTATNAIPVTINVLTTAADPSDAAGYGLSRLDATISSRMATFSLPANFSAMSITAGGLVDITQAAADKAWGTTTRLLTAGTNIVLAKGVGVTGFNDPTATENADALLKRDMSAVSGEAARSPLNALRLLRNKWSIPAGVLTVTKEDDTTTAWTGAVTSDAAANPITAVDPA